MKLVSPSALLAVYSGVLTIALTTVLLTGAHKPSSASFDQITVHRINIVEPDIAFFGQKDAQQALVIRHMVRDLDMRLRVEVCPTVREGDGLAMSSRNSRLDAAARRQARALSAALFAAERAVASGTRDAKAIMNVAQEVLYHDGVSPEYLSLVSTDTLLPVAEIRGEALLAVAARVGGVRLIDNTILRAD